MAWPTNVQNTTGTHTTSGQTSAATTFAGSVAAGNIIVVGVTSYLANNPQRPVISDTQGNRYLLAAHATHGSGMMCGIYYANNVVGGANVVTCTVGAGSYIDIAAAEFSGASFVTPYGFASNGATGTNATDNITSGSVPIEANGTNLLLGITWPLGSVTVAAGTGFSGIDIFTGDASHIGIGFEHKTGLTSAAAATFTFGTTAQVYPACAVSLKRQAAAGGSYVF